MDEAIKKLDEAYDHILKARLILVGVYKDIEKLKKKDGKNKN